MSDTISKADSSAIIAQARHDSYAAGYAEGLAQAGPVGSTEAALKQGAADERTRCAAIIGAPEAEGRRDLAHHLALSTDMAPDAARSVLAVTPKAEQLQPHRRMSPEARVESSREAWGEVMQSINAEIVHNR